MILHRRYAALLALVLLLWTPSGAAAQAPSSDSAGSPGTPTAPSQAASPIAASVYESAEGAPIVFHGDTIVTLHSSIGHVSLERRAQRAAALLEGMRLPQLLGPVTTQPLDQGHVVMVGDVTVFLIVPGDIEPGSAQATRQAADQAAQRLRRALVARAAMLTPGYRLRAAFGAILATVALYVLVRVFGWARRRALDWMASKSQAHRGRLRLGDVDFIAQFSTAFAWTVSVAAQLGILALVALWGILLLNLFPETQRWGAAAEASLLRVLRTFEQGLFHAIPGLVAVALIVVAGRFATKLASDVFGGIERGTVHLPGVHPETAGATRRLVITMIWLFAIVVAYPLLPGSDSVAFKGVSVFLGLILTLGSSGFVGHIMSGLVLVYSRALRPGDLVRVTEIEGMVTEVGALSVKLVNAKDEEFTIPNTVLVSTTVKNYSRRAKGSGGSLTVSVAIGYDAPWRVVNELLCAAAARTPGVRGEPAPVVYQTQLSAFAVEYQLVVRLDRAEGRLGTRSELIQNIQDAFNERGVQVMTPAYESQPERPVIVPKSHWAKAPGDRVDSGGP